LKSDPEIYKKAKGFNVHPENINRKGTPRKSFSSFNLKCKNEGIEKVDRTTFFETISYLLNLTFDELDKIRQDSTQPQWLKWLIQDLGNKNLRAKLMTDYRDWLFGKAEQKFEHSGKVETADIPIIVNILPKKE
jgi:hypothetical protein